MSQLLSDEMAQQDKVFPEKRMVTRSVDAIDSDKEVVIM